MIECKLCSQAIHSVRMHLKKDHQHDHPGLTEEGYLSMFPGAPLISEDLRRKLEEKAKETVAHTSPLRPLAEVFKLGDSAGTKNARGEPIRINVLPADEEWADFVPDVDPRYIFGVELLKNVIMGIEANIPTYLWGHAGTGKSSCFEQICAHTNRPYVRIQHTANTEEAHIVGQMLANESGTYFEPGPLALAMKHGLLYCADEYDFAHPSVVAIYQAVLEGKPLVIKEAPREWRHVKPHANFRFVATGNTNGSGDETGLYQGTNLGNAANYSRFGITIKVEYMPERQEAAVISSQTGVSLDNAKKLVDFANRIRKQFGDSQMSATIGPRELIYAAKVALFKADWVTGLEFAFINRLTDVDAKAAKEIAQRIFG